MRSIKDYLTLLLKGVAMGSADVVPGVSGGTIAFITGIYEELLRSIKSIDAEAFRLLFKFNTTLWVKSTTKTKDVTSNGKQGDVESGRRENKKETK